MAQLLLRVLLLGLLLAFYWSVLRSNDPRANDFAAFYSGALLWAEHKNPYDLKDECAIQAKAEVPICLPFFHPPLLLPALSAVSDQDYQASYLRWFAVLLLTVIICGVPLYYLTKDFLDTLLYLTFLPIFAALLQGQDTTFVLLGMLTCFQFLVTSKDALAGTALGLTVLRPHWAIALGFPLLFSRPKAFRAFCATVAALVAYNFALVGLEGVKAMLSTLAITAKGGDATTQQIKMYNLVAVLTNFGLSPVWAWPFFVGAIAIISVLWRKCGITRETFSLAIILTLFFSPHLHTHDLAPLVIPLLAWPAVIVPMVSIAIVLASGFNLQQICVLGLMAALSYRLYRSLYIDQPHTRASMQS